MKIFINGCSFSRGPDSWPYYIEKLCKSEIFNLALSGAGNTYIRHSTVCELYKRSDYKLVIIMWSGLERLDFQVDDLAQFPDFSTSLYQSQRNDWPEKIVEPFHDQDFVQKNWILGGTADELQKHQLFLGLRKHVGIVQHAQRSLVDMLCLQEFLKSKRLPYVFAFYQNYLDLLKRKEPELFQNLDLENVFNDPNIGDLIKQNHWVDEDGYHPSPHGHKIWASMLHEWLVDKRLI